MGGGGFHGGDYAQSRGPRGCGNVTMARRVRWELSYIRAESSPVDGPDLPPLAPSVCEMDPAGPAGFGPPSSPLSAG